MGDYYIMVDGEARPVDDVKVWARWMESNDTNRIIAKTMLAPGIEVSTVFLGLDHSFGDGPPIMFETMVFGGDMSEQDCRRYASMNEARQGHLQTVSELIERLTRGE